MGSWEWRHCVWVNGTILFRHWFTLQTFFCFIKLASQGREETRLPPDYTQWASSGPLVEIGWHGTEARLLWLPSGTTGCTPTQCLWGRHQVGCWRPKPVKQKVRSHRGGPEGKSRLRGSEPCSVQWINFRQNHVPPLWILIIPVRQQISTWYFFSFVLLMYLISTNWYVHNSCNFVYCSFMKNLKNYKNTDVPMSKSFKWACGVETLSMIYSKCSAELVYLLILDTQLLGKPHLYPTSGDWVYNNDWNLSQILMWTSLPWSESLLY